MKVKTKRRAWDGGRTLGLEVLKADDEGDVYVGTSQGGFYLQRPDVSRFIAALKWAIAPQAKESR